MHPELSVFPSTTFYEGTLQIGVTPSERMIKGDFPWPSKYSPMFFYNVIGIEEISSTGTSYLNRRESEVAEHVVNRLIESGLNPQ